MKEQKEKEIVLTEEEFLKRVSELKDGEILNIFFEQKEGSADG